VDPASKAHALAAMLLPFVRDLIVGPTPLHLLEAPTPGTGKGLLADVICIPATGRGATVMAEGQNDEEWRKRITASLIKGPVFILLDNLRRRLTSGSLAAALTSVTWEDRRLGVSEIITAPNRAVWLATGNNVALSDEIARRTVLIRLDAKIDMPWKRTVFRHSDLKGGR
jgi:putative DNA primase/helicase